jgi:hypothetical protein
VENSMEIRWQHCEEVMIEAVKVAQGWAGYSI